jgi:phosphopantothenoylcysteine decarboxylase / phosphopantothenate---cysteine ligase
MRLKGKNIVLGVTGSIAAYKAAYLLRLLTKEGAEVQVVMTPSGKEFITPLTFSALSGKPVVSEFFSKDDGSWNSHVGLGLWADALVIAPATATTIGKMANGIADNILITTYLSAKCPVFIAPAMDLDMYQHTSTQDNLKKLASFGNHIIDPVEGELASGLEGQGRMEEPEQIAEILIGYINRKKKLLNKTFLVTAGPTYEKIDPVRFIGNYSSGKMGFAVAEQLAGEGAKVKLVTGPVNISVDQINIDCIRVESANEMYEESVRIFPDCDGAVMAAAVADFTPEVKMETKIGRGNEKRQLTLVPTKDIAAHLGSIKKVSQVIAGFALEISDDRNNAKKKLIDKNLDFIVLNSLNSPGSGFDVDTNKITIIDKYNNCQEFELKSKSETARDIVNKIIGMFPDSANGQN